jgi:hypothetical protein
MIEIQEMIEKIEQPGMLLDKADIEFISNSSRLLDRYRNRWWSQDIEAYFVQSTHQGGKFKAGE